MFNSKLKTRIAELEKELKASRQEATNSREHDRRMIARLKGELNGWREANNSEIHPQLKVEAMASIKFSALFNGVYQPTHFKLGLGTCGKVVCSFSTRRTDSLLVITQNHTDGTHKEFEYRLSDIDGRIQYDYEMVELVGEAAKKEREAKAFRDVMRKRF